MKIIVNGIEKEVGQDTTVAGLVELLGLAKGRVAVELNREILTRERYADTPLKEGDVLEILSFVGGG